MCRYSAWLVDVHQERAACRSCMCMAMTASAVWRCPECKDFHILLVDQATPLALLTLGSALAHLAEHHAAERMTL